MYSFSTVHMATTKEDNYACPEMCTTHGTRSAFSGKRVTATEEIEDVRPLKKRPFFGEEYVDSKKLFRKALQFEQELVENCRKLLIEVTALMIDVENKGMEINTYLNSTEDIKADLPVKKRSTSQEHSRWLHPSKREELLKYSTQLSENITDCNVKLEHLRNGFECLNKNMSFLKEFFSIVDNQEKTSLEDDDLHHLKGTKDMTFNPWTPHEEHFIVHEAVAGVLADLSGKMDKIGDDLKTLSKKTVIMENEVRSTMIAIRRSLDGNCNIDLHRKTSNTSAVSIANKTECSHSFPCPSTGYTEKPSVERQEKPVSDAQSDFLRVEKKDVTITITSREKKEQQCRTEGATGSTDTTEESKPIIIPREEYDKIKKNTASSFARKLLKYFFTRSELELCNYNTLQERRPARLTTLIETVEIEFPGSTVGGEAMKKIRDGINSSCRAYKEKLRLPNPGQ